MIPEKKKEYSLKNVFPLHLIKTISYPKNNKVIFKLGCGGYL